MSKALLEVKDLHVRVEEKEILHGVNLTVGQDETHVLMGPNGTGKSTLGYAITGNPAYSVTAGSILFDGADITALPVNERAKKGIFLSFQNPLEVSGVTLSAFIRSALEQKTGSRLRLWDFKKQLKETFERLGIPQAERKSLAGVGAQYDSELVYHNVKDSVAAEGVVYTDMESALKGEYADMVRKYF